MTRADLIKNICKFSLGLLIISAFVLTGSPAQAAEAIGIRILANPGRLSPFGWYFQNVPNPGQPEPLLVNGYPAIREGRTVYVAATNQVGDALYGNIYLISYSEDASQSTIDIFNQLLENWDFNINVNDLVVREQLRRDMKRAGDMSDVSGLLERYRRVNGNYPLLQAGTYIRGLSFSVWPSWQATLANLLASALPQDPLNRLIGCQDPYDQTTCWDEVNQQFQCSPESRTYAYQVDDNGDQASLYTNYEYTGPGSWRTGEYGLLTSQFCFTNESAFLNDEDGDGILNSADNCPTVYNPDQADFDRDGLGALCDLCDLDPSNDIDRDFVCGGVDNCPKNFNPDQTDADADGIGDACDIMVCGNAIKEGDEVCDGLGSIPANSTCLNDCSGWTCNEGYSRFDNICDIDTDGDLVADSLDNCSNLYNPGQLNSDNDIYGDACDWCPDDSDNDIDGDGYCAGPRYSGPRLGANDICPTVADPEQANTDGDELGDACDQCPDDPANDPDDDGVCAGARFNSPKLAGSDNCPAVANQDQADFDRDGIGDACDPQTCGNNIIEAGEKCDQNQGLAGIICTGQEELYCSVDCQISCTGQGQPVYAISGSAWSSNIGWINLSPSNGGVTISLTNTFVGSAWSANVGWINMSGATVNLDGTVHGDILGNDYVGVINYDPSRSGVRINSADGTFSGFAWGENIGWIDFNGVSTSWKP
ncbi:MAG TPA: thrombospondin type 3 repeat-containing protein [Patescibacteria group bacterium]